MTPPMEQPTTQAMTQPPASSAAPAEALAQALARLQGLRAAGAAQSDPIGLAYLEGLALQAQAHYGPLQARLQLRLGQALDRFEQARAPSLAAPSAPGGGEAATRPAAAAVLAELNRLLREASAPAPVLDGDEAVSAPVRSPAGRPEMKSVTRFREGWSRLRAETRVTEALGRKPENAGPLNSHALLLRSLDLMRGLSPDYLRRFVTHVDALLWLDQASQKPAPAKGKAKPGAGPRRVKRTPGSA